MAAGRPARMRRAARRGEPRRRRGRAGERAVSPSSPRTFSSPRAWSMRKSSCCRAARPLRHGARVRFHQGTVELLGRVALPRGESPDGLAPGRTGFARLRLELPAVVTRGDRFILRAYSPPVTDWRRRGARSARAPERHTHSAGSPAVRSARARRRGVAGRSRDRADGRGEWTRGAADGRAHRAGGRSP